MTRISPQVNTSAVHTCSGSSSATDTVGVDDLRTFLGLKAKASSSGVMGLLTNDAAAPKGKAAVSKRQRVEDLTEEDDNDRAGAVSV